MAKSIITSKPFGRVQTDTTDSSKFSTSFPHNLTMIDTLSKTLYARPLKNHTADEMLSKMKDIFNSMPCCYIVATLSALLTLINLSENIRRGKSNKPVDNYYQCLQNNFLWRIRKAPKAFRRDALSYINWTFSQCVWIHKVQYSATWTKDNGFVFCWEISFRSSQVGGNLFYEVKWENFRSKK